MKYNSMAKKLKNGAEGRNRTGTEQSSEGF